MVSSPRQSFVMKYKCMYKKCNIQTKRPQFKKGTWKGNDVIYIYFLFISFGNRRVTDIERREITLTINQKHIMIANRSVLHYNDTFVSPPWPRPH